MRLKHRGALIEVTLTVPEHKSLQKAMLLLDMLAKLPCDQAERAGQASKLIGEITSSPVKEEPPTEA